MNTLEGRSRPCATFSRAPAAIARATSATRESASGAAKGVPCRSWMVRSRLRPDAHSLTTATRAGSVAVAGRSRMSSTRSSRRSSTRAAAWAAPRTAGARGIVRRQHPHRDGTVEDLVVAVPQVDVLVAAAQPRILRDQVEQPVATELLGCPHDCPPRLRTRPASRRTSDSTSETSLMRIAHAAPRNTASPTDRRDHHAEQQRAPDLPGDRLDAGLGRAEQGQHRDHDADGDRGRRGRCGRSPRPCARSPWSPAGARAATRRAGSRPSRTASRPARSRRPADRRHAARWRTAGTPARAAGR